MGLGSSNRRHDSYRCWDPLGLPLRLGDQNNMICSKEDLPSELIKGFKFKIRQKTTYEKLPLSTEGTYEVVFLGGVEEDNPYKFGANKVSLIHYVEVKEFVLTRFEEKELLPIERKFFREFNKEMCTELKFISIEDFKDLLKNKYIEEIKT